MALEGKQYEVLMGLAYKVAAEVDEDVVSDGFLGLVEENLPKGWKIEWFDGESDDDDLDRKELLVERDISKSKKKNYKVFTFAYCDSGCLILGAPSFQEVKEFLEGLLKKVKDKA